MSQFEKAAWAVTCAVVGGIVLWIIQRTLSWIGQRATDTVQIDADLRVSADLETIQAAGCPGLVLTITGRGKRPAKISKAFVNARGFNPMEALQDGFEHDFGYTPVEGDVPVFFIELLPLRKSDNPDGYVLERDDVCHFYLPIISPLNVFIGAASEDVFIDVEFFDKSKKEVERGLVIQDTLRHLIESFAGQPYEPKIPLSMGVKVVSETRPSYERVGTVNPKPVHFPDTSPPQIPLEPPNPKEKGYVEIGLAIVESDKWRTAGVTIGNTEIVPIPVMAIVFVVQFKDHSIKHFHLKGDYATRVNAGGSRSFVLDPNDLAKFAEGVKSDNVHGAAIMVYLASDIKTLAGDDLNAMLKMLIEEKNGPDATEENSPA